MPKIAKGLLLVTMEPPAGFEDEFNDWYDTEHFPQRRSLPGFESGSRWVCLEGWPKWLAIYDLASVGALDDPAYAAVSGANSTPWSKRILPRTLGRKRVVAEQIAPGDALTPPAGEVGRLLVASFPAPAEGVAERIGQALSGIPGLGQSRLFRARQPDPGELWLLAAFEGPVTAPAPAMAAALGLRLRLFNLYAPYFRS